MGRCRGGGVVVEERRGLGEGRRGRWWDGCCGWWLVVDGEKWWTVRTCTIMWYALRDGRQIYPVWRAYVVEQRNSCLCIDSSDVLPSESVFGERFGFLVGASEVGNLTRPLMSMGGEHVCTPDSVVI